MNKILSIVFSLVEFCAILVSSVCAFEGNFVDGTIPGILLAIYIRLISRDIDWLNKKILSYEKENSV